VDAMPIGRSMPLAAHYRHSRLGAGLAEDVETALRASGRTDSDRRNEQLAPHRELAAVINQGCISLSTASMVWMLQTLQGVMH
jgi:hypothetical protein